jgi:hypothetical protein
MGATSVVESRAVACRECVADIDREAHVGAPRGVDHAQGVFRGRDVTTLVRVNGDAQPGASAQIGKILDAPDRGEFMISRALRGMRG